MRFDKYDFHPQLIRNLAEQGFKKPTDIQYKSIPPILKGEDVLAVAQTGTGKTAAFAIPVIEKLIHRKRSLANFEVRCMVMVPTHELAMQVAGVFDSLLKGTGLKVLALIGGVDQTPQINRLKKGVDIMVATPGRMFDLSSQGYLDLKSIEILILDEADHMLELGFYNDMRQLFRNLPKNKQTLFFSATIDEKIKDLAYGLVRHAVRIHISPKNPVSGKIDHAVTYVEMDHKRFFLERIVRENPDSKILVFVRTKVRAERVLKAMERVGLSSETIHSDKDQKNRNSAMSNFREGINKVLIATDVSARGVDIPNVEIVVNYDLPEIPENYVHRVGRTGRGVNRGKAVSFCSDEEREILEQIEEFLTNPIAVINMNTEEYEKSIDFSPAATHDWKSLIDEDLEKGKKKIKKRR
ncbi:DEAD/DEAH box helicase [Alkalitalea saponilacus]|uniref:ATP-dependent RNA helicase RhlE n=1 Tax=Alkalitalea saponilacus TaxID=889453 RepID=A0A1T5EWZ3_9BACT|nr:DEAD/DEAH box helicase [Alkalitalea saponilacus]ASB47985.1 RNA helicase [Alkalitalea saponilacus]SKB88453.1 ATP-dependent RNA helicase RhlE [Alkalitalea saponilacus]